jgi:hypothetical protein
MASDDLAALEKRFFALVTRREGDEEGPPDAEGGGAESKEPLERWLVGSPAIDAAGRLSIYADMYAARMIGVLAEDFRLTRLWMGPEAFDELATDYLAKHPSRHPSLRHFGRLLPDFARTHRTNRAGLSDLMALEWARGEVFDAADQDALDWGTLAALDPEAWPSLRLGFVPAARVVRFGSSVDELWAALHHGTTPPEPRAEPKRLLVWRRQFIVYHRPLPDDEANALEALAAGARFDEVCERFAAPGEPAEAAAAKAFTALRHWAADGLLVRALSWPRRPPLPWRGASRRATLHHDGRAA